MAKLLGLALAVLAGTVTALLLAAGVSTHDAEGQVVDCSSVIGAAAVDLSSPACTDPLVRRTELAAVTGLLCIAGATVVAFAGRPAQPTSHPTARNVSAGAAPTR